MTDSLKITIIGAGLIGLCTADALAARGADVTVIEARPGPCEGTSYSNSGMIHPSQALSRGASKPIPSEFDAARVTAALGKRSRTLLLEKTERLGLPLRKDGCVELYDDMDAALKAQVMYEKIGVTSNILIEPVESFGRAACQFTNDSSGDSRAFGCALAADLDARGVRFIYGAGDPEFRKTAEAFYIKLADEILETEYLVLAAGIQTAELLHSKFGLRMQLKAVSGAAADFALPDAADALPSCPVMDSVSRSALTIFEDRLRISGGWGIQDPAVLIARWREIAPALHLGEPLSTWTGVRPVSPVGRPYISGTSIPKLWVNTGHGHMGWTLSAGSGELLSEMILDGRDDRRFVFSG